MTSMVYCGNAATYTTKNADKPWKYILLPQYIVKSNIGFDYLMKEYEYKIVGLI